MPSYYERNKERINAKRRARIAADPEKDRQRQREYYAKNKERILEYKRKHREKNREKYNQRARESRKKNPDAAVEYNLRKKYGITLADYARMLIKQGEGCAICGEADDGALLAVDHCHETGEVRGILCRRCNTAIGKLSDDPTLLASAIDYLEGRMPASPTQLTLREMRNRGYTCEVVEKFNYHSKTRKDLYGCIDVLCVGNGETVAVQSTTYTNVASRVSKIAEADAVGEMREAGWRILVHGWHKPKHRWVCREVDCS